MDKEYTGGPLTDEEMKKVKEQAEKVGSWDLEMHWYPIADTEDFFLEVVITDGRIKLVCDQDGIGVEELQDVVDKLNNTGKKVKTNIADGYIIHANLNGIAQKRDSEIVWEEVQGGNIDILVRNNRMSICNERQSAYDLYEVEETFSYDKEIKGESFVWRAIDNEDNWCGVMITFFDSGSIMVKVCYSHFSIGFQATNDTNKRADNEQET